MPLDKSRKCVNKTPYTCVLITMHSREGATIRLFREFLAKHKVKRKLTLPIIKIITSEEPYNTSMGTHFHAVITSELGFRVGRWFTACNKKGSLWEGMAFHAWPDLRKTCGEGFEAKRLYCERYLRDPSKDKILGQVEELETEWDIRMRKAQEGRLATERLMAAYRELHRERGTVLGW